MPKIKITKQLIEMIAKKDRTVAGACAPANGLRLVGIEYPDLDVDMYC